MITKSDFRTCRGILDAKVRIQIFQIKECEMWEVMWMFFCVSLLLLSLSSRLLSFEASYMCLTDLRALFHYYIPTPSFQAEFSARSLIAHDQLTAWIFMLKKEQLHGKNVVGYFFCLFHCLSPWWKWKKSYLIVLPQKPPHPLKKLS